MSQAQYPYTCPECRYRIHNEGDHQCTCNYSPKDKDLAGLRAKLQAATDDLQASTEQHIMDDEIIVGLRAKLAEAEANLRANAAMLARQTDLAREAEAQAEQLEKRLDEMADLAKGYRVERDTAIEREETLREVLPPVAQLKLLAAWLDIHDDEFGSKGRDVQLDLRNWADKINAALATPSKTALINCAAGKDGDCMHPDCPQLRDGEPAKSGRHCPLDQKDDEQ